MLEKCAILGVNEKGDGGKMPTYAKLGMTYNISNSGMPRILTVLSDIRYSEISESSIIFWKDVLVCKGE